MDDAEETAELPPPDGTAGKIKRPRLMPELRSLARSKTASAINVLFRIMLNEKASSRVRMAAANSILDRGMGPTGASNRGR